MKTRTRDGYFDRITRAPPPIKTNLSPQPDTTPGRETRAPTKIAAAPTIRLLIVPPAICRPVYASIPDPSSRIPIRNRSVRFVLGSLPPEFPKLGRLEILQVGEEVVGIELQIRGQPYSHRPRSELDEARSVRRRKLLPALAPSAREIDPVERQRPRLGAANDDRPAVGAPLDEEVSRLGSL